MMEIVFKNFWILFILFTIINVFIIKKKVEKYIVDNPEKENGYKLIIKNFLIFSIIPWVIIGIGNSLGLTNSVFEYLQPAKMNPIVLIFHFSIIMIWIMLFRFIFFKNGAKFLENHPGVITIKSIGNVNENPSEKTIKFFIAITLIGGIVGMTLMWFIEIPFPNFK
ncbi:hypothetical protein [Flavobacterium urocaniciphilum]|uniref:Uncharacterized protein n=1 Tax=Flavobacterium urocaniciphilum TaxID=1299341 RepID=A0A1H8YY64_9FLAO|nr:hypothetical protein [Flavobacterium urocaniciphilum]SEP57023.1 hypothetical protein SAMN05444005_101350 [Flavobacterium urocaniciphilum]